MNSETPLNPSPEASKPVQTPATPAASTKPAGSSTPVKTQLYRSIDWWAFAVTALVAFLGYYFTMAPDLTLQDSGEEAVGSMYAGVPHPPGYPFWTIITWLFTKLFPFSNIAWRVGLASVVAASLSCGFLALMISRGSSMIIESISDLKGIDRRWENALCLVAAFSASMFFGFNGFVWSQAIIVEVYPLSFLSLTLTLCFLLRWMFAPEQRRYLYLAALTFGIGITNHQTLIVAIMGVELAIIAAQPKLGRDLLAVNCAGWFLGVFAKSSHLISTFDSMPGRLNMVYVIFNLVGVASLVGFIWLTLKTKQVLTEWKTVLFAGIMFAVGASFYFYMPIASMSNPPMNWGYPRTVEGFFHALSRGQYERTNPTNFIEDPSRFLQQIVMCISGAGDEFTWVYLLLGLVPFAFFFKMQKRERAWMIGLAGIYICLAFLLTVLMNPSPDRQTKDLIKVFFTNSYVPLAMWIGYGLALVGAWLLVNYERARFWVLCGTGIVSAVALVELTERIKVTFGDLPASEGFLGVKVLAFGFSHLIDRGIGALPVWGSLVVLVFVLVFLAMVLIWRRRLPFGLILALFAVLPSASWISHWSDNEQRGHLFGFWFGHDMFTPPYEVYPEMDRDAVLFGGTDPGRFCPTYMIFCESFIPAEKRRDPKFDRRDVYLITQNALADGTYLNYIRAHYNRSAQIDPPFFQNFLPHVAPRLFNGPTPGLTLLDDVFMNLGAKIETSRRTGTSIFEESHFVNVSSLADKLRKQQDPVSKFLVSKLSKDTLDLLASKADEKSLRRALAKDFNAIIQSGSSIWNEERFKGIKLPVLIERAVRVDQTKDTTVRLNRRMLEEAYAGEIAKSLGGVFPDTEIHTPSPGELQSCFDTYLADAARRVEHDQKFPNEPPQVKPGEDVRMEGGRVQVSGQVAVMSINGLLTKVIFDANPDHEFYVEESFPLDWMYPHLTPFGIIMKINRQPLTEMTQDIVDKDHQFWTRYSERLIGNFINYDTTVPELCEFVEKIYVDRNYSGYKGNPLFLRDNDGQKAFSKLRSSIGGVYQWRAQHPANGAEQQRMLKEAEFAFKQAFAYCPYSPEAVFRYSQLLLSMGRIDDALMIARSCQKLDPFNSSVENLIQQLEGNRRSMGAAAIQPLLAKLQGQMQARLTNETLQTLDQILAHPQVDHSTLMAVAGIYLQLNNSAKAEQTVEKMTQMAPGIAENWYNLASLRAAQGKAQGAMEALKKSFEINDAMRKANPALTNIREHVKGDRNFEQLRQFPEYQKLINK